MFREIDLARNNSICHFIAKIPNTNPAKKRNIEGGKDLTAVLNSLTFRAGLRNDKTCTIIRGITTTNPVTIPHPTAKL